MDNTIKIRGAAVNNLKSVDLDIPRDKFVVITGVSGSGKSSLAFDTLFAEGQRRFAESLSSFARQFLGRMSKPAVESITGIPPAIAIEQKVSTRNPRSTVGSSTEIYDYLRLLFAKIGRTYSPISMEEVNIDTVQSVLDYLKTQKSGTTFNIVADIKWGEAKQRVERLLNLKEDGFSRLFVIDEKGKGRVEKIDTVITDPDAPSFNTLLLLIDRVSNTQDDDNITRIIDSVHTAFDKGEGSIFLYSEDGEKRAFSNLFEADGIQFEKPQEWLFNFNNPLGACPKCEGFGKIIGIDESLVVPNPALSLYQDAIACWRGEVMSFFKNEIIINASKFDFPIHTPYFQLTQEQKETLWNGNEYFTGINQFFKELEKKRYKIQNKYMISRYSGKTICPECRGKRLKKESLYVRVGGKNIAELLDMSIEDLLSFFNSLELNKYEEIIASKALKEIKSRLRYIVAVGLPYLTLSRLSNSLSGGESQRINLVSSLGNTLTGSMYILDEPSIGLHQRDTQRLISVLKELRDIGNSVIVVEHDEEIIRAADYLIDIGPHAGSFGGEIVYQGAPPKEGESYDNESKSLTLKYLSGVKKISIPSNKRSWSSYIEVKGACENNLKNIDVKFPLKIITAVVGVSGSGKSTLVGDILYPALNRHINQIGERPGAFKGLGGDLKKITSVEFVDQNPIGKSTRSNPATYLKIYDDIRKLYSDQPYAKLNGYGHTHFSFNIDGGRCPECLGEGTIKISMQFMADITIPCESCGGRRFKPDILEVRYKEKNISDILDMTVDEAYDFFSVQVEPQAKRIAEKIMPLKAVGLNYVRLGQSSSTLSGGESQRVKLAYFLGKESSGKRDSRESIFFIFDEPTTGLHFDDIQKLLDSFNALIENGHTIIVVEHNPYIIQAADHIIELGPEGGDKGGYLL